MQDTEIRTAIRQQYGAVAKRAGLEQSQQQAQSACYGEAASEQAACGAEPAAQETAEQTSCCGGGATVEATSRNIGYTDAELGSVPGGSNLGLGCGNPTGLAAIQEGDTVLDLGSGAGFDCFLAANKTGKGGHVIGVDMTPEMIEKARDNARKSGFDNVEFRLGEIENLPVQSGEVDLIISNCVINLSTDKAKTFKEAHRALKSGGSVLVSDIVLVGGLPEAIRESVNAYVGCVAGALQKDDYIDTIKAAGFEDVEIVNEISFGPEVFEGSSDPLIQETNKQAADDSEAVKRQISASLRSIQIRATKS